ncbi:alpha/beta hydrolase [Spirochaetia bacterium]|nr:alpha/beta hydrolase [Spirochaetia bacterium]
MSGLIAAGCAGSPGKTAEHPTQFPADKAVNDPLRFDPASYTEGTVTVDGKLINYRAYEGITFVAKPVESYHPQWQQMNIYVPEAAYSSSDAPILLRTGIGGYMPADPIEINAEWGGELMRRALAEGYVAVSPGSRGWSSTVTEPPPVPRGAPPAQANAADYIGKAPAAIVDLKAAVRYLRHNDGLIPGSAEKIITDGTSAGGALSALLGASGNNPLYTPYLQEIGAADARDDIFAAVCFCPITDMEHADMSYEYLYSSLNNIRRIPAGWGADAKSMPLISDEQKAISLSLQALYPAYLNGLALTNTINKTALRADNITDYIKEFLKASAQKAYNAAADKAAFRTSFSWLSFSGDTVTDIDLQAHLTHVAGKTSLKTPPAFDAKGVAGAAPTYENNLFGTMMAASTNFTDFSQQMSGNSIADEVKDRVYLMNAMNFIGNAGNTTAPNWYIRHGSIDRDTAFNIPVVLYTALANKGYAVDFAFAWERPHTGDYDLDEVFAWINGKVKN